MAIEKIIKERMKLKKMSIRQLAREAGVDEPGLGKNLNGKCSMTLCKLYKISEVLGIAWTEYEIKRT